jgi:Tfp pilus assembly protein PilO
MKTSTKRILSIALSGLFFVGIIVVYSGLIRPELAKINEKRALLISKETLFNNEQSAVNQVEKLLGEFQNLTDLQSAVSLALPLGANVTDALSQIQSIARLSSVTVSSFSIKPLALTASKQPLVKRLGSLEVSLAVAGSYDNLKNFVRSLETNVRVSNAINWRLAPSAGAGDNMNLDLTVDIYYQEQ